jgi:hypothetical protein
MRRHSMSPNALQPHSDANRSSTALDWVTHGLANLATLPERGDRVGKWDLHEVGKSKAAMPSCTITCEKVPTILRSSGQKRPSGLSPVGFEFRPAMSTRAGVPTDEDGVTRGSAQGFGAAGPGLDMGPLRATPGPCADGRATFAHWHWLELDFDSCPDVLYESARPLAGAAWAGWAD